MKKSLCALLAIVALTFMGGNENVNAQNSTQKDVVEVIYFHGKQRCVTCNAIEKLTKEVVGSLADKKVVMRVVDITKDEAAADKYEVTWSSLILDRGGKVDNLTEMGFSYAKNQPQVFKTKLVEAINKIKK